MTTGLDAISTAILSGRLASIVDDMKAVLSNTAQSNRISVSHQFSCSLLDKDGNVVSTSNPRYLVTSEQSVASCTKAFAFDLFEGDVIFTNDPYGGTPSVHYFTLVKAVFDGQDLLGYVAVQAHLSDIGGMVMGNYDVGAHEVRTEGVRFTPMRLVRFGRIRRDLFDTLVFNSRSPDVLAGDLRAMMACLDVGERAFGRNVSNSGANQIQLAMAASLQHADRSMRHCLSKLPEGEFNGEAALEDDGHGRQDLRIRVKLVREGERLTVDFTGTDVQSTGFVNSTPAVTKTAVLSQILGLLTDEVAFNSGLLEAFDFVLPEGSLVSPVYPAPTGWSSEHISNEVAEAVRRALAEAVPESAGPGYPSRSFAMTVRRVTRVGMTIEQDGVTDLAALAQPGSGAAFSIDGWGQPGAESLGFAPSVEQFEAATAFSIQSMEFATDSAGAGMWRGAPGVTTVVAIPVDAGEHLYALSVNRRSGPQGVAGGSAGAAGSLALLTREGTREDVTGAVAMRPLTGKLLLEVRASGGGGFGNPAKRSREAVESDLRDGYISPEFARLHYQYNPL
jgi:N-methylhydantoinase B